MLFDTFPFESTDNLDEATVVFFDCFSDLGVYDLNLLQSVRDKNIPVVAFQNKDYGGMSKERWVGFDLFPHNKKVMFIRKYDKEVKYPEWCYPYEECYYPDHDFEPVTKEELSSRPNDLFFAGNLSPQRMTVCGGLQLYFSCDFRLGLSKIEHDQWLNRARLSKLCLSVCGGGFTDERKQQLFSIAPIIRNKNNQLVVNDFTDMVNCIEVNEHPTQDDIEKIKTVLNNPQKLYEIYRNGIEHMKKYFSKSFRSNYILSILKQEGIC